ncbi:hypothetical protein GCM10023311_10190 [Flaviramulus aquimarinus]|uniref:DUF547 domain-containing protein n=1 Tax=Flaviramulus aquimarinus TaxID=1170456 RepID=A0ABP9EY47_9FLAO
MKHLQLLVLLILTVSCSGTKHITQTAPKETSKGKTNDSVIIQTKTVKDNPEIITAENNKPEVQVPSIASETVETEAFNHILWHELLQKHVSNKGHVNYKAFKANRNDLQKYILLLSENLPNKIWSKEDKLAYWINAYNAMTVDLITRHYPIKSIKDIKKPWDQRFWKLGNKWYNLNEIEHDILRQMDEPRIHFAIVCASFSCPKLQNEAFTASNIETQLTHATKGFLSDSERNSISENSLELSKIFQWFAKDFIQEGSLIDFLNQYSDIKISDSAKKRFRDYNWDLNE